MKLNERLEFIKTIMSQSKIGTITYVHKVPFPVKIFIPQPYAVDKYRYGHGHHHQSHHYDHHSDYSNKYPQHVSAVTGQPQSSEQSSSTEYNGYLPRPEHLRSVQNHHQTTKLFSPYQTTAASSQEDRPYNQQHQLHHQQQYVPASMRKDQLVRHQMKYNSDEDSSSTEFRPMHGQSMEDISSASTNNVETVVPPPPSLSSSSSSSSARPFHINVPERLPHAEPLTASSNSAQNSDAAVSTHNQYQQNIEIPVHFFRLQPIEPGQGFAIAS